MAVSGVKGTGIGQVTLPEYGGPLALQGGLRAAEPRYLEQITGDVEDYTGGLVGAGLGLVDILGELLGKSTDERLMAGEAPPSLGSFQAGSMTRERVDPSQSYQDEIMRIAESMKKGDLVPEGSKVPGLGTFTTAGGEEVRPGALMPLADELGAMGPDGAPTDEGEKSLLDRSSKMDISSELGAMGPDGFTGAEETSKKETGSYDEVPTKGKESTNVAETGFSSGMKAYLDALTGTDTSVKDLDEYKKEFAEATGINISGKPDKSSALMAFGLALMQNKAGKGFNVGRMLSALGEAGEKAMPAFEKAKAAAKAEQLAAGKYALDARGAALTKAAATRQAIADRIAALSDKAYDRETQMQVQRLKGDQEITKEKMKLLAEEQRLAVEQAQKAGELGEPKKLLVGGTDRDKFEVQGQQVGKSDVFKIVNATGAMNTVEGQIRLASQGLDTAKRMREIAASGDISGGKNLFNSLKLGFEGIISLPFDESKAKNSQAEYKAAVGSMLVQFRRMLTGGEAGNAISDRDVEIIKENLGYLEKYLSGNLATSSQEIVSRVDQLVGMFEAKLTKHSNMKKDLIRMGQLAGQYQEYDLSEDSDFTDDFSGYTSKVMPDGRIRYSLVDKG